SDNAARVHRAFLKKVRSGNFSGVIEHVKEHPTRSSVQQQKHRGAQMIKWPAIALMIFASMTVAAEDKPRVFAASLQQGSQLVADSLGENGAWLVQSRARWDELLKQLKELGVTADDQLGALDFAKENIACVFHYGDRGDQFSL